MIRFISEQTEKEVTERRFDLEVDGETVPGIVWAPESAQGTRPLLLFSHGGGQHKRSDNILSWARTFVRHHGYAVVAIDAPGHGDRVTPEQAARLGEQTQASVRQRAAALTPEQVREWTERTNRGVKEWKATLDAAQELDYVGKGPVGYWGASMGAVIGVPFVAAEPRVKAAIFGLVGLRPGAGALDQQGADALEKAARSITIPLIFMFQWDDEIAARDGGLALYDAFGSEEKSMHINPGPHVGIPGFELGYWEQFYVRHLGSAKA